MKWINGLTWSAEKKRKEQWHKWFAWHPVKIGVVEQGTANERKRIVWLETIWRKGAFSCSFGDCWWDWEYSLTNPFEMVGHVLQNILNKVIRCPTCGRLPCEHTTTTTDASKTYSLTGNWKWIEADGGKFFSADPITIDNWEGIFPCRKKPVVVHACQMNIPFEVTTLEGKLRGNKGDYLMIGVKGEKYPCKKEIFEETYQRLDIPISRPTKVKMPKKMKGKPLSHYVKKGRGR